MSVVNVLSCRNENLLPNNGVNMLYNLFEMDDNKDQSQCHQVHAQQQADSGMQ